MAKLIENSFLRFLLVGVGNTLLSMAITFTLFNAAGVDPVLSSAIAYVAGAVMSFFLNRSFTFHSQEDFWPSAAKFALNVAVCWAASTPFVQPAVAKLLAGVLSVRWAENLALLFSMGFYTLLNYFGQRFFAFRKSSRA